MRKQVAALAAITAVAVLTFAAMGGHVTSSAPAEAASIHVAATAEPVPASNAQPGATVRHRSVAIPFYWAGGWNWDGRYVMCLYSDSGRALYCY